MHSSRQYIDKWKSDYDFKTFLTASASLAVTVAFAFYNGFLGIHHASLWHGAICVYYILLSLLRGLILMCERRASRREQPGALREQQDALRNRVFLTVSVLLLFLNICLVLPLSLMVRQQKPIDLTLIPAIAMAAYTTYKITMASVNLWKRKKSSSNLVWLLRTIGFIDALVSILTLQNTLIMVNSNGADPGMLPLTATTSAVVWVAILLLSMAAIVRGVRGIKDRKSSPE